MVEKAENITNQFFKAIYQLVGWPYDPINFNQHSLEARTVVNQYIYEPLTSEQKQQVDRRSKTNKMKIPPPLGSMIDLPFVSDQVTTILNYIQNGKTLEELDDIYPTGDPVSSEEFNALVSKMLRSKE